jgi:hypothetical protein
MKLLVTKTVGAGYAALKDETSTFTLPDDMTFDAVIAEARKHVLDGGRSVSIISKQVFLTLITHNDFGGHLLIGSPKPNPRSWGVGAYGPKVKNFGNNVSVRTHFDEASGLFVSVAIYARKVLNEFKTDTLTEAEDAHKLLCETWGKATPGNLKDEAQDAPFWKEA